MFQVWPRYLTAFLLGFGLDLFKRSYEPFVNSPLSILIIPFAAFVSSLILEVCVVLGLPIIRSQRARTIWFRSPVPATVILLVGGFFFLNGIHEAHHAYFVEQASPDSANAILRAKTLPGFVGIVFSVLYWPFPSASRLSSTASPPP